MPAKTSSSEKSSANPKKADVIASLETLLADSYALMAQTHLAHWNVEGSNFFQLHLAFEQQYQELFVAVDGIAEHLRTFESYAPGGFKMLAGLTKIGQMDRHLSGKEFVTKLAGYHEILIANAQKGRATSAKAGFNETEDLFIERLRVHDKTLWMLKSYLK